MDFTPKNPTEIPRNVEYHSEIENNPFSMWSLAASVGDDPNFMPVEKDLFKEICRMLEVSWIEINKKALRDKTNVLAKFIYGKLSENEYAYLKNPTNLSNFQTKVNEAYQRLRSSSSSVPTTSERKQADKIIGDVSSGISECIRLIDKDASDQINSIMDELLDTYLSRESIVRIVENNPIPASPPSLSSSPTNLTNVSADVISLEIQHDAETNVLEDEEDANIFMEQMEIVRSAIKEGGTNVLKERVKDISIDKSNAINSRLITYERLKTYYHNLNSLSENRRKTRIGRAISKPINFLKAFGGERGTQFLVDAVKKETIGDTLFRIPFIRKAVVSSGDDERKEFFRKIHKVPIFKYIAQKKSYSIILTPVKLVALWFLSFEVMAIKVLSVAKRNVMRGLKVLNGLVNRVGNSIYDFFKGPTNAFLASFAISFSVQVLIRAKSGKLSKMLHILLTFAKLMATKIWKTFTTKFKTFWKNLKEKYPILQKGENFFNWLKDKIKNSLVFRTVNGIFKEFRSFTDKVYEENKLSFNARKEEFKKKGIDYTMFDYMVDPDGFLNTTYDELKTWWDSNPICKTIDTLVKVASFLVGKVFKNILMPIIGVVSKILPIIGKSPWDKILETLCDYLTTPVGALFQGVGMAFGPIGSIVSLGLFIAADLFYKSIKETGEAKISIRKKYLKLYGMDIVEDVSKITGKYTKDFPGGKMKEYLDQRNLTGDDREKVRKNLTEKFEDFYKMITSETEVLTHSLSSVEEYSELIKLSDNKLEGMDLKSALDSSGITGNIFSSNLLGTDFDKWRTYFDNSTGISDLKKRIRWQENFLTNFLLFRQSVLDNVFVKPITNEAFSWYDLQRLMESTTLNNLGKNLNNQIENQAIRKAFDYKTTGEDSELQRGAAEESMLQAISSLPLEITKRLPKQLEVQHKNLGFFPSIANFFGFAPKVENVTGGTSINPSLKNDTIQIKDKQVSRLHALVDRMTRKDVAQELFGTFFGKRTNISDFDRDALEKIGEQLKKKLTVDTFETLLAKHNGSWPDFIKEELLKNLFPEEVYPVLAKNKSEKVSYNEALGEVFEELYQYYSNDKEDQELAILVSTVENLCDILSIENWKDVKFEAEKRKWSSKEREIKERKKERKRQELKEKADKAKAEKERVERERIRNKYSPNPEMPLTIKPVFPGLENSFSPRNSVPQSVSW